MVIFLFGLAGVGKSYVGDVISKHLKYKYIDADNWLPSDMLEAVAKKQPFTQEMRDNFTDIIIQNTQNLINDRNENLVITQALYKERNRQAIKIAFTEALFIQVAADYETITKRLLERGDHVQPDYAKLISKNFEPMEDCFVINNETNGRFRIIKQIDEILSVIQKDNNVRQF